MKPLVPRRLVPVAVAIRLGAFVLALAACDRDPTAPGPRAPAAATEPIAPPSAAVAITAAHLAARRELTIPAGFTAALTHDVNDSDVLVGYLHPDLRTGNSTAVPAQWSARWDSRPTVTLLPLPAGTSGGNAMAINESGVVVGTAGGRAIRWRPGVATPDVLPASPQSSGDMAMAVNDEGDAVGRVGPSGAERAAFWDRSETAPAITLLQTGASTVTGALAINNAGVIVGYRMAPAGMLPVRWTSATAAPEDLPLPDGYHSGEAEDIAEDGTIVGGIEGTIAGRLTRNAAVWRPAGTQMEVTVLPKLPSSGSCFATAISAGTITTRWIVGNCGGTSVVWARDGVYAIGLSGGVNGYSYGISASGLMPLLPSTNATQTWALQLIADPHLVSDPGGPYSATEGSTVSFDGSASSGWPVATPLTYEWKFYPFRPGDPFGTGPTPSYTYPDNGLYAAELRVSDGSGLPGPRVTASVTISNVAPSVNAGADVTIDAGQSFTLGGSFSDPGVADGPWSYWIDWGDGSSPLVGSSNTQGAISVAKVYAKAGSYTVKLSVQDKDYGVGSDEVVVTVRGSAPTATPGGPYAGAEGAAVQFDGSASSDPDGGALTYAWSFGDGTTGTGATPQHVYADDGTYTVTLTVSDGEGQTHTAAATATIADVPPRITSIGIPATPVPLGTLVTVTTVFGGAPSDQFSAVVSWDDGTTSPLSGVTSGFGATHSYATPGVYAVKVRVTDDDGRADEQTAATYLVVYDPSTSSFATGAGTIDSPAGAMPGSPTAAGRAAFGFQSRYLPGAQAPSGFTRFDFRAGGLEFEATRFDWLVVAGTKAQFKGEGTIAGRAGTFRFMLTAVDGGAPGTDRFRVKITDAAGNVVYDNQQGASDGATPATVITSGNITVR